LSIGNPQAMSDLWASASGVVCQCEPVWRPVSFGRQCDKVRPVAAGIHWVGLAETSGAYDWPRLPSTVCGLTRDHLLSPPHTATTPTTSPWPSCSVAHRWECFEADTLHPQITSVIEAGSPIYINGTLSTNTLTFTPQLTSPPPILVLQTLGVAKCLINYPGQPAQDDLLPTRLPDKAEPKEAHGKASGR
jgi:hypothetical protein